VKCSEGDGRIKVLTIAIVSSLTICSLLVAVPFGAAGATEDTVTVFRENFENPNWSCDYPWDQDGKELWVRSDTNAASGIDSWCFTTNKVEASVGGQHSVWCAVVGANSIYQDENHQTQYNNQIWKYDANMTSSWRHSLNPNATLGDATMTFRYWSKTSPSTAPGGYDHLGFSVSSDNSTYNTIWTQPSAVEDSWKQVTVTIPASTRTISFDFISGPHQKGRAMEDGAYLDNILVTQRIEASWSFVQSLPTYSPSLFDVNVSVDLSKGTPSNVKLFYRNGTAGAYNVYTDPAHTDGAFPYGSPINFDATKAGGEKSFQFFSVATIGGIAEAAPATADATTTVDSSPPVTVVTETGTKGTGDWFRGPVTLNFTSSDSRSGVQTIQYNLDHAGWQAYNGNKPIEGDGIHDLVYRAIDRAGNEEGSKSKAIKIDGNTPVTTYSINETGAVTLMAQDVTSGVNITYYRIGGGGWVETSQMTWGQPLMEGTIIEYYSDDLAGNTEGIRSVDLGNLPMAQVDLFITLSSTEISSGGNANLSWTTNDPNGIVDHFEVLVDNGEAVYIDRSNPSYELQGLSQGEHLVTVKAVDRGGNSTSQTSSFSVAGESTGGIPMNLSILAVIGIAAVGGIGALLYMRRKKSG
jgi:hypothetical protein